MKRKTISEADLHAALTALRRKGGLTRRLPERGGAQPGLAGRGSCAWGILPARLRSLD